MLCMKFGCILYLCVAGFSIFNLVSACIIALRYVSSMLNGALTIACITQTWMMFIMRLNSSGFACAQEGNETIKLAGNFLRNMIIAQFCLTCCLNVSLSTAANNRKADH